MQTPTVQAISNSSRESTTCHILVKSWRSSASTLKHSSEAWTRVLYHALQSVYALTIGKHHSRLKPHSNPLQQLRLLRINTHLKYSGGLQDSLQCIGSTDMKYMSCTAVNGLCYLDHSVFRTSACDGTVCILSIHQASMDKLSLEPTKPQSQAFLLHVCLQQTVEISISLVSDSISSESGGRQQE